MFRVLARLAQEAEVSIYLVGGPVRDALLRSPVVDLDFSVVGDGVAIANRFAEGNMRQESQRIRSLGRPLSITDRVPGRPGHCQEGGIPRARQTCLA